MSRKFRLFLARVAAAVLEIQGPSGPGPSKRNKAAKRSYSQRSLSRTCLYSKQVLEAQPRQGGVWCSSRLQCSWEAPEEGRSSTRVSCLKLLTHSSRAAKGGGATTTQKPVPETSGAPQSAFAGSWEGRGEAALCVPIPEPISLAVSAHGCASASQSHLQN